MRKFKQTVAIALAVLMLMSVAMIGVSAEEEPIAVEESLGGFYVVGNFTNWGVDEAYKLTENAEAEGEYMFTGLALTTEDQFKVAWSEDGATIADTDWFPTGMGNNYGENGEITADGTYDVYFRADGNGGEDWFYNTLYVVAQETGEEETTAATEETTAAEGEETTAATEETTAAAEDTTAAEEETTAPVEEARTILFTNNVGWEAVYAYTFYMDGEAGVTVGEAWPGTEMTSIGANDFGEEQFSVEIGDEATFIVFNDGNGTQTDNLELTENTAGFYFDAESETFKSWDKPVVTEDVEDTTAATEEDTSAVEDTTAADEETTAAVEDTTAADEETTAATEETTAAVEETTAATEETTAAVEETTAAVEETTAAVEDTTAAVEETTAATEATTAAIEETTAATEATTAAPTEAVKTTKKANTMKVSGKTVKVAPGKKVTVKKAKAFTVKNAKGKVTFKKVKGNKKIIVKSNGKIVVKKGLKKGKTYTIKVKVTAKGTSKYKKASKTVKVKIKIKKK